MRERTTMIRLVAAVTTIASVLLAPAPMTAPALAAHTAGAIAPNTGGTGGGTTVTITGTGFVTNGVDAVCFGADAATINAAPSCAAAAAGAALGTGLVVTSETSLTVVTPPHAAGAVDVAVHHLAALGAPDWIDVPGAATDFTYVAPTATGVSPTSGPTTGGAVITITGTNLSGVNSVTIDGVALIAVSATSITAVTPVHPVPGTFAICVDSMADPDPPTCGPVVFTYVMPTPTPSPLPTNTAMPVVTVTPVPTPIGGVNVTGSVVGTAPGGTRGLATGVIGAPIGSHRVPDAHVVAVDQVTGAAFGTHASDTGSFSLAVPPGTYRLSIADNDDDRGQTDCAAVAGTPCGHLINQQLWSVPSTGLNVGAQVLAAATVPGALPGFPPSTLGFFGEARDAAMGNPIVGAVVRVAQGPTFRDTTTGADGRWSLADPSFVSGMSATVTLIPIVGFCAARELVDLCSDSITPSAGWNHAGAFLVVGLITPPPPPVPGPNFSLALNGTSAHAEVPHSGELNLTGDWTVEAWFKDENSTYDHARARILSKGDTAGPEVPYFLGIASHKILAGLRIRGTAHLVRFDLKVNKVSVGSWHHVAATLQTSTDELILYLDGVPVALAKVPETSGGNSSPLSIGRSGQQSGDYWRGKIDDVRVWNIARTADDIRENLDTELIGTPPGLVGNWRFNEGTGPAAADSTVPAQNAALLGGASFSTDVPAFGQPPTPPGINIGDASCSEGSPCVFTVTRSGGSGPATVSYKTANGTATGATICTAPGADFISAAGTVSIEPNSTAAIAVATCRHDVPVAGETFTVRVSGAKKGTIFDASGVGTIGGPTCIAFDPFGNCIQFGTPPANIICLEFNAAGQCIAIGAPGPVGSCPLGYFWNGVQCVFGGAPPTGGLSIFDATCTEGAVCSFSVTSPNICIAYFPGTSTCSQYSSTPSFATMTYFTSNGTAVGGTTCTGVGGPDFVNIPATTISFTGSTTISVTTCADAVTEGPETLTVTVSSPDTITTRGTATGTIAAN